MALNWGGGLGGAATGASIGSAIPGIGTAIGAGVGGLIGLFNNPYGDAEKQAKQGWGQAQDYQRPYWQHGMDQYDPLNQARTNLMDPEKLQSQWASGYENSPYAKQMLDMNRQSGIDAASSMGLGGSSAALANIQAGAGNIVQKDRQQYMDDLMKKYMAGIGLGQNIYGVGANTGANLGQGAMTQGQNMAQLAYGRAAAPGEQIGQAADFYTKNHPATTASGGGGHDYYGTAFSSHLPQFA